VLLLAQQYKPEQVLQVFESMLAARQAAADRTSVEPAALSEFIENFSSLKLQAVGAELSTFAVAYAYNNLDVALRGVDEAQAVGGRGCRTQCVLGA
jgi:hypothetical protein